MVVALAGSDNFLYPGNYLYENQVLLSKNGQYQLKPQSDGNLVLRDLNDGKTAIWSSGTHSADADDEVKLYLDPSNGHLILYHGTSAVWDADVCHYEPLRLQLQSDGNLVLVSQASTPYWAWKQPDGFSSECGGTLRQKSFSLSLSEWDTLVAEADLCQAAYTRDFADPLTPQSCPDGYPDWDGLLTCYEACPEGWTSDGLTMCYEDCGADYTEVLGVCWDWDVEINPQSSIERGVGIIPNSCTDGRVMESGLCYNQCRDGYTGGACHCWKSLFDVYGRGCGTIPDGCPSSHPSYEAGLCYKECPADHPIKDGIWCAEDCSASGAVDTGLFCHRDNTHSYLQKRDFRPSKPTVCQHGEAQGLFCYDDCRDGFDGVLGVCWNQNLGTSILAMLATAPQTPLLTTCYAFISAYIPFVLDYGTDGLDGLNFDPFLDCASTLIDTLIAIDGTWSREGITVAATYDAGVQSGSGFQGYGGIAFEFVDEDNINLWAFVGACRTFGSSISIGINGGISLFRSVDSIDGVETFFSAEVDIPILPGKVASFGVGASFGFDEKCKISGMTVGSGISVGSSVSDLISLPIDVQSGVCANAHREYLTKMVSPSAQSSAKRVAAHPEPSLPKMQQHDYKLEDMSPERQSMNNDDGEDYVVELRLPSTSTLVICALCILSVVLMVLLCVSRFGDKKRIRYKKVMDTDTEMEMVSVNPI